MVSYDKKNIGSKGTKNRLNPYCSGRWSRTVKKISDREEQKPVLILIVVEDGLVRMLMLMVSTRLQMVLILIVVEDGLVHGTVNHSAMSASQVVLILIVVEDGLVPIRQVAMGAAAVVLILIVVEDGLVPVRDNSIFHILHVLILIVVEDGLVLYNT